MNSLRHPLLKRIIRICLIAEDIGNLDTEVDDLLYNLRIVILTSRCSGVVCHPDLLAQLPVGAVFEERAVARIVKSERPAFKSLLCGSLRSHGLHIFRKAGKTGRIRHMKRICIGGSENIPAELEGRKRKFL